MVRVHHFGNESVRPSMSLCSEAVKKTCDGRVGAQLTGDGDAISKLRRDGG